VISHPGTHGQSNGRSAVQQHADGSMVEGAIIGACFFFEELIGACLHAHKKGGK